MHALRAPPAAQRLGHVEDAVLRGTPDQVVEAVLLKHVLAFAIGVQAGTPVLQRAHGLAQGLFKRAADPHDLADGLHARGQHVVGALELLEREARSLHHAVVDRGLEACRRGLRDIVDDLIERVSDGKARRSLRDGETGRLRCKRRRARHAGVHLDDHHAPVIRVHGELHVRSARFDAHLFENGEACRAHTLVFHVAERLSRGDGDGVARVHAHGVQVLDGADDDAVSGLIAHDLHLVFFPAFDGFFNEHLAGRRQLKALRHDQAQLLLVVRDATAGAAHGEARAQNHRIPELFHDGQRVLNAIRIIAAGRFDAKLRHALVEQLTVLAALDGFKVATDHLDAVFLQDAGFGQLNRRVQAGLPAQGGQQRIRMLASDYPLDELGGDGLDIGAVGHDGIGHDGRRVGVDQHHAIALVLEHLARLRAGVIEFARLTDDDGTRADDQDGFDVVAFRHSRAPSLLRRRIAIPPSDRRRCRCPENPCIPPSSARTP